MPKTILPPETTAETEPLQWSARCSEIAPITLSHTTAAMLPHTTFYTLVTNTMAYHNGTKKISQENNHYKKLATMSPLL